MSGAAPAAPQVPHHDAELQDLRRQLNYRNAEATNLRTNLAAVQSELAAAKIAAARGAVGGGGRQDGEASRLRREILQLRTKLEFAEQARREMQHAPAAVQAPQRRTTAAQTDAEQLGALPALPSPVRVITSVRRLTESVHAASLRNMHSCGDSACGCNCHLLNHR